MKTALSQYLTFLSTYSTFITHGHLRRCLDKEDA
jgi:hypothetical protein